MTYYSVANHNFTHYGKALSFSRAIGKPVVVRKTCNPFKILLASI
ncbi:MAG: hypothetical protein Unbinned5081contig1002_8 [Prokaryotic dsDNA virus sp.]|nr:MAG: hypothetical protein Unbinned5081contig1002_8 [Prokaryotic dsDNA virus sp.]